MRMRTLIGLATASFAVAMGVAAPAQAYVPQPDAAQERVAPGTEPRTGNHAKCKDGLLCAVASNGDSCAWSGDGWDWGTRCGRVGDGKDGFSNRAVSVFNAGVGSYSYLKLFDAAGGGSTWTCLHPGGGLDLPYARWQHGKDKGKSMNRDISGHVWVKKCTEPN